MPRNMSFSLTADQILNRTKTVTRRLGWRWLKSGTELKAVRKSMGLKKGEKVEVLTRIRVTSVRREPLSQITYDDIRKEGFPGFSHSSFVEMFIRHMRCSPNTTVTRIEFEYLDDVET